MQKVKKSMETKMIGDRLSFWISVVVSICLLMLHARKCSTLFISSVKC